MFPDDRSSVWVACADNRLLSMQDVAFTGSSGIQYCASLHDAIVLAFCRRFWKEIVGS
jgi:hypothetical protein